jgi:hypothetical protein
MQASQSTIYSLDALDATVTLQTQFSKSITSEHKASMDARKLQAILDNIS